jgi:dipeptidase D
MPLHPMTSRVLKRFAEVSAHPRRSKAEGPLIAWLMAWADGHGFETRQDQTGNLVIAVPASPGAEHAATVILQGHLDMVCEAVPGSTHDFSRDAIVPVQEGEWLRATETSLGADNGIAIALAMELCTSPHVVHPLLELLFTVDEEVGMSGALGLDPALLTGRILINLDSEDEGVLTVGCAGGIDTRIRLELPVQSPPTGHIALTVSVGGLVGGHSGIDIHLERASALRLLARALDVVGRGTELRVAQVSGGSADNAIPRQAAATVYVPAADREGVVVAVQTLQQQFANEHPRTDPDLFIRVQEPAAAVETVWTPAASRRAIDLLLAVPHGVATMSMDVAGLVESSNNLASAHRVGDALVVRSSQRSSVPSRLTAITAQVESVGRLAGGDVLTDNAYAPWPPDLASPLLARCQRIYQAQFGKPPVVEIMHAGLECGVIGERVAGMDMISLGPTVQFPHSPGERLHVPTIGRVWDLVVAILADLAEH